MNSSITDINLRFLLIALAPIVLFPVALRAESAGALEAKYRTKAVTVYTDRALVTVSARVLLRAGRNAVRFSGLPGDLRDDSISCSAGGAGLKIRGIELGRRLHQRPVNAELRRLEGELQALKDRETRLSNLGKADRSQLKFIDSLEAARGDTIAGQAAAGPGEAQVAGWRRSLVFFDQKRRERYEAMLQNDIHLREVRRLKKIKQEELGRLSRDPQTRTRSILVYLQAGGAGPREIQVRYVIPRAGWQPSYDLRADAGSNRLELTYYGTVSQRTGRDWKRVKLAFSTARPGLGASPAPMLPVLLTPGRVVSALRTKQKRDEAEDKFASESEEERGGRAPVAPAPTVLFEVPGLQSIPSGDRPRRVTISVDRFTYDPVYVCKPKVSRFAFIRAAVRNDTGRQLLGGQTNVFLGGDFVGRSRLGSVAAGQDFTTFLGIDERLKLTRKPVLDKSQEAFWGDKLVLSQGFRIQLENYTGKQRKLLVQDQIPVSRDAGIRVRNFAAEPAARLAEESGEISWELELDPGEKRALTFRYEVVFPPEVYRKPGMRKALDEMRNMW